MQRITLHRMRRTLQKTLLWYDVFFSFSPLLFDKLIQSSAYQKINVTSNVFWGVLKNIGELNKITFFVTTGLIDTYLLFNQSKMMLLH